MKIFSVLNNYTSSGDNKREFSAFPLCEPVVCTLPDTALLKESRPFFIPDFARPCSFRASLVVHISRLGRCISSRFARRYYDAVTLGVSFCAGDLYARSRKEGLPLDPALGFDNAAVVGSFIPLEEGDDKLPITAFRLETDGKVCQLHDGMSGRFSIEDIIAHVSRYSMLRRGDLLFVGYPCEAVPASEDVHLDGYVGEEKVLSFNVK